MPTRARSRCRTSTGRRMIPSTPRTDSDDDSDSGSDSDDSDFDDDDSEDDFEDDDFDFDDDSDSDDEDSDAGVSAHATPYPCPVTTAAPTPRATAKPPTRPPNAAAFMDIAIRPRPSRTRGFGQSATAAGLQATAGGRVGSARSPPRPACRDRRELVARSALGAAAGDLRLVDRLPARGVDDIGPAIADQFVQRGRLGGRVGEQAVVVVGDQVLHGLRGTRLVGADEAGRAAFDPARDVAAAHRLARFWVDDPAAVVGHHRGGFVERQLGESACRGSQSTSAPDRPGS